MSRHLHKLVAATVLLASAAAAPAGTVLVEAEGFDDAGGWVVDQQFMGQMGSPFLLAHGLGEPVADAVTTVTIPEAGTYVVWVRTRDWVWMSDAPGTAGLFKLAVDATTLDETFGTKGKEWHWHAGGKVKLPAGKVKIALKDLTGFEGRCDAICLSSEAGFTPPNDANALEAFRREALGLPAEPPVAGEYDLVVVGGGNAGVCAAVAAARLGLKVALIQNRPVLGGNNSSEVRVWRGGGTNFPPYPRIGDLDRELGGRAKASPGKAAEFHDNLKGKMVTAEKNIELFLEHHADRVHLADGRIASVDARHIRTGKEKRFAGRWFADCTGDGTIGHLAGADWEMTRKEHMGRSNMWRIVDTGKPVSFPRCPWAHDMSDKKIPGRLGIWYWESGFNYDGFAKGEHIRDNNFRGMYGTWDALKNVHDKYPNHKLQWAAYISGKRESRRLLGDVVVTKEHVLGGQEWPDPAVPCTWSIDLHYARKEYSKHFGDDAFISHARMTRFKTPYWIPYRSLYSRNVPNLFMAGRCISVTHEALGTVRVMRTTAMMGEVVGMAASVCKAYDTSPRGVFKEHLAQLQAVMTEGVGKLPPRENASGKPARLDPPKWVKDAGENLATKAEVSVSSLYEGGTYPGKHVNDGKVVLANDARWVSQRSMPQHVELTWPQPVTLSAVRLVTGYRKGAGAGDPIQSFVLQVPDGDGWKDVPGTKVTDNTKIDCSTTFPPVTARRVRMLITASHGNTARVWELELYHPSKP